MELKSLVTLLESYKKIGGQYPTNEQGLKALVINPDTTPLPHKWAQISQEILVDPWSTPYQYHFPGTKEEGRPEVISAGPDRKFGTEDDFSSQDEFLLKKHSRAH